MFFKQDTCAKIAMVGSSCCFFVCFCTFLGIQSLNTVPNIPIISSGIPSATHQSDSLEDNQDLLNAIANVSAVEIIEDLDAKFMSVDIMSYVDKYPNICAYLQVPSTQIDFPIVQYDDNEYYLNKGYAQQDYNAGAPFLDYRNSIEYLDYNNIIYAHNMADGSMFGTLQYIKNSNYFDENDGYIYLNTIGYKNIFKVYSVYEVDLTSFNYIQTAFYSDDEFSDFISKTQEYNQVSALDSVVVPASTKILTLSTCTANGAKRLVVQAYLYNRCVY